MDQERTPFIVVLVAIAVTEAQGASSYYRFKFSIIYLSFVFRNKFLKSDNDTAYS